MRYTHVCVCVCETLDCLDAVWFGEATCFLKKDFLLMANNQSTVSDQVYSPYITDGSYLTLHFSF